MAEPTYKPFVVNHGIRANGLKTPKKEHVRVPSKDFLLLIGLQKKLQ